MAEPQRANSDLANTFRALLTIRRFEERLLSLYAEGRIAGSMHLCPGQEAIPVGACRVLEERDALTVTYRGHGWAIARGIPLTELFAEMLHRDSALCGGRGGSPYFNAIEYGFLGENSVVGAGVPIATGAALASRYDGTDAITLVDVGDGATNQGAWHEGLNFAAVYDLPLVMIVENNIYSEMTPISDMVRVEQLAERAGAYGVPGQTVDGNDVDAVQSAVAEAVDRARGGDGPTLIEAMTERIVGHYTGDSQHYRPAGEVEEAKKHEPIARLRDQAAVEARDGTLDRVAAEVDSEIEAALREAMTRPLPDPRSARDHVYVD